MKDDTGSGLSMEVRAFSNCDVKAATIVRGSSYFQVRPEQQSSRSTLSY